MKYTPILPLDFWRQEIGYNPWHFWGLADSSVVPVTSKCNDIVYEHAWQGTDEAGREDIRQAIMNAEYILSTHLGYWPAPIYLESKHDWPRYYNRGLQRITRTDVQGRWLPVYVETGYVKECGIERLDLIDGRASLVFSDSDGDGLDDIFTITVATTVSDATEIAVYFAAGDRLLDDDNISDRWRIEPLHVTISGGFATIVGRSWLVVRPVLYENKTNYPIDPTDAGNFISSCEVYRRYTYMDGQDSNVDSQSALIWESRPCCWPCDCSSVAGSNDPASEGWIAGRAGIRNGYNGYVTPAEAVYNSTTLSWSSTCGCIDSCGEPDRVLVRYLAGHPLDDHGWMQKNMRTLVSRLAAAEMTRRICACDQANREWSNWQFDVSRINSPETYQANLDVLANPLGTRRGHIYAWQQIAELARVVGVLS